MCLVCASGALLVTGSSTTTNGKTEVVTFPEKSVWLEFLFLLSTGAGTLQNLYLLGFSLMGFTLVETSENSCWLVFS